MITPETEEVRKSTESLMEKAIDHLEHQLTKIRAGKASPQMLDGVMVDYYGTNTPIAQVGSVNTPDARTIVVQPWEKNLLKAIEKAIIDSNLGFNPQNDRNVIRIALPTLTEERRKALVKQTKTESEDSKIAVRNLRRDANDAIDKLVKAGLQEDAGKGAKEEIQTLTDRFIKRVDEVIAHKEKDIMTV